MIKKGMDVTMAKCEKRDVKASGNTITVKSVCNFFGRSKLTSTGVWTYKGDTAYQMVSDGNINPPMMGTTKNSLPRKARSHEIIDHLPLFSEPSESAS